MPAISHFIYLYWQLVVQLGLQVIRPICIRNHSGNNTDKILTLNEKPRLGGGSYGYGTNVTISATPNTGIHSGWMGSAWMEVATTTVSMSSD